MPGGGAIPMGTADTGRIEAPVTAKAYFICAFAAFGGIVSFLNSPEQYWILKFAVLRIRYRMDG